MGCMCVCVCVCVCVCMCVRVREGRSLSCTPCKSWPLVNSNSSLGVLGEILSLLTHDDWSLLLCVNRPRQITKPLSSCQVSSSDESDEALVSVGECEPANSPTRIRAASPTQAVPRPCPPFAPKSPPPSGVAPTRARVEAHLQLEWGWRSCSIRQSSSRRDAKHSAKSRPTEDVGSLGRDATGTTPLLS